MSTFTKKHYEVLAGVLKREIARTSFTDTPAINGIFRELVRVFEADNKKFDYNTFYKAVWK
jgi:hypothetical protein